MSSSAPASSASTPLDVNSMIAAVGQAARADAAEREAASEQTPSGPQETPEFQHEPEPQDEPSAQAVPPPASTTMQRQEPVQPTVHPAAEPAKPETVADFLGMDAGAIDRLAAALGTTQPCQGPGGPGAPAAAPAGPAGPAAPAQPGTPDLRFVTDEQIDAQADIFGDEAVAVLKPMAASPRQMHEHYERQLKESRGAVDYYKAQEAAQINKTVGGFFGGMKDLGLDQKYGTAPVPQTQEQAQARMQLAATVDRVWQALGGKHETLDQALKTAVYLTDRQAIEDSIAQRARFGVRDGLQKRRGMLDATPGGSGGPKAPMPNDPNKAALELANRFVAAQRG